MIAKSVSLQLAWNVARMGELTNRHRILADKQLGEQLL